MKMNQAHQNRFVGKYGVKAELGNVFLSVDSREMTKWPATKETPVAVPRGVQLCSMQHRKDICGTTYCMFVCSLCCKGGI